MRIQKLRIHGFKSFAKRVELDFDPGVTAIVGPNGCGKSNVVDAMKWVLGEQRPTSIRAKEMADVIFSGTGSRKAVGMAEVSLGLDNSDGRLPLEESEVVLSRRLYRSGESEYLINGSTCRLKDLREVLMDTGSGLDAFSIMEQGKIDAILVADPVERRTVFEEAAGIGRYKARRKETLRRLERVADDLTRLADVIDLTGKELRSLRYQAGRAARYRELSEELRKKQVTWALHRYHTLLTERGRVAERLVEVANEEGRLNEELTGALSKIEVEEGDLQRLSQRLRDAEARLLGLEGEIRSAHERSEHGRRLAKELADRVAATEDEIRLTGRRREELQTEREGLGGELAALAAEVEVRQLDLERAEEAIGEARKEESAREADLTDLARRRRALEDERLETRNERASLSSILTTSEAREQKILRRQSTISADREERVAERDELSKALDGLRENETALRSRLESASREAGVLEERLGDVLDQSGEAERKLSGMRSRLDVLQSMKARREGMDKAVRRILEEAARDDSPLTGVRGAVVDLVQAEGPDARAVDLSLGVCAQGIVTDTLDDAIRAIEWLKENDLGRAVFLPLEELREAAPGGTGSHGARSALAAVRAGEERYERLLTALLSDSLFVDDLETAKSVARNGGRSMRIVTGGGEVLGRIGTISGGGGRSAPAFLSRNVEIDALGNDITAEERRRNALAEAKEGLREKLREQRSEEKVLREELEIAVRDVRRSEAAIGRIGEALERLGQEEHVLSVERNELLDERATAAERDRELEQDLLSSKEAAERLVAEEKALRSALEEVRALRIEAEERKTEARVALARARERLLAGEARLAAAEKGLADAERNLSQAEEDVVACRRRRDEALSEEESSKREAVEKENERKSTLAKVEAVRREHEEARDEHLSRRKLAEELRDEHERYRSELQDFRMRENEIRVKVEDLSERVRDEFDLDLADLHEEFEPGEVDRGSIEEEVSVLKEKLGRMGNVNLTAIDQLGEVEERARFLEKEKEDLVASRKRLNEILDRLNKVSRERFESAFEQIRQSFRATYRKLFGGGSADIRLTEGEDVLEAGIEILCRPPGRELQNLNLLSGGEKTMTAVALLFAIFQIHASPFVLMDEVDAALDEANIDRFLVLLRDYAKESQFVVITHNKRTMAVADTLYGVSMPEAGVSEPVSIRFSGVQGGAEAEEEEARSPAAARS